MEEGKLGDVCPACGVPAKLFEPYKSRISEKRRFILKLDIHPVIVHAPQAVVFLLVVFAIGALIFQDAIRDNLVTTIAVLAITLPITVLAGFATGLTDGLTRFKKLKTPFLKRKIVFGTLFFLVSAAGAFITISIGPGEQSYLLYMLILSVAGLTVSTVLGLIGSKLLGAAFPG
jgi:uncharacterized membrane protein